jgi:hypothetical protein
MSARVELYQISRHAEEPGVALPVAIDVGDLDFRWLLRGFYGRERMADVGVRWTSGHADVALPRLAAGDASVTLLIRFATHRPPGVAMPTVRLSIEGADAGRIEGTSQGFETYQIELGPRLAARLRAGPSTLTIAADSFVPKAAGAGDDRRALGVAIDWLRFE